MSCRSCLAYIPRPYSWTNSRQSLKSFPPCYTQSPLQLWREISISSNSSNLLQLLQFSYCTVYTVKEKGGKSDRKPCPLPYGLRNPYRNLKSENSQDCTLMNLACRYNSVFVGCVTVSTGCGGAKYSDWNLCLCSSVCTQGYTLHTFLRLIIWVSAPS